MNPLNSLSVLDRAIAATEEKLKDDAPVNQIKSSSNISLPPKVYPSIPASQLTQNNPSNFELFNSDIIIAEQPNDNSSLIKRTITKEELKNDKSLLSKSLGSFQKDQYIQSNEWKYVNDDYIAEGEKRMQKFESSLNRNQYSMLCISVKKCKIKVVHQHPDIFYNVCPLSTLEYMVESTFFYDKTLKVQMLQHVLELDDIIYRWRSINGDGNCFYRACIFSFLENIIFTKNILLLKEFICDFDDKLKDDYQNVRCFPFIKNEIKKINKPLVTQILFLILSTLDNEGNGYGMSAYEILIKAFNFCKPFDYGMIFYFRFLIYEFIKANWNKAYTTEFSVKIGNLLPAQYETSLGDFLYDKYYEEQLLKMNTDAEKIVIYLTPFVLKCDLNVVIYEFDKEESVFAREFKCGKETSLRIELLFRKTHYDIIYNKKYFTLYQKELCSYVNVNENLHVIDNESLNNARSMKRNNSKIKENLCNEVQNKQNNQLPICMSCKKEYNSKDNVFCLCDKCLRTELESQIFGFYLMYLQDALNDYSKGRINLGLYSNNYFKSMNCVISNQPVPLIQAATIAGTTLTTVLNSIKPKICLLCQETINNGTFFYKLPCNCVLCSLNCFTTYFNFFIIEDLKNKKETHFNYQVFAYCLCGYQFSNNDYIALYEDFRARKLNDYKTSLKEIIISSWKEKCMVCLLEFNSEMNFYYVTLKDKRLTEVYKVKEFKHILCQECFDKLGSQSEIDCVICGTTHKCIKFKKYNEMMMMTVEYFK